MITQPGTDRLLRDCCRELTEAILPALDDDTVKLRLIMTVTVLENAAVRAAHEIAWMRAERAELLDYAREVASTHGGDGLAAALATATADRAESLHLADVTREYELAGSAFDAALARAQEAGAAELIDRAAELLRRRVDTEKQVMASYAVVGR
jgi:hypothetical protein